MTHTHTKTYAVVSHHRYRRTARAKEDRLTRKLEHKLLKDGNTENSALRIARDTYSVKPAKRGPWRWNVVKY